MIRSFLYSKELRHQWQSAVCMIPVLLDLLKEKLNSTSIHEENFESLQLEIKAYQEIYRSWKKNAKLNPKQQEWIEEIGIYLKDLHNVKNWQRFISNANQNKKKH
jgi:PhoPQ-activated pathogenicity-related protein